MKKIYLSLIAATMLAACGGEKTTGETAKTEKPIEEAKEVCTYSYDVESTEVLWVAYKYTQKTGVKGVFDSLMVEGVGEGTDVAQVIQGAGFTIFTSSVNSGDPTRDPKIMEYFFGKMELGEQIYGSVKDVMGNESEGKVIFDVTMNGVSAPVEGSYTVVDNKLEVKAEISVVTWKGEEALNELNMVCEDLHKGADGESILWPDVTLYISANLNKACN